MLEQPEASVGTAPAATLLYQQAPSLEGGRIKAGIAQIVAEDVERRRGLDVDDDVVLLDVAGIEAVAQSDAFEGLGVRQACRQKAHEVDASGPLRRVYVDWRIIHRPWPRFQPALACMPAIRGRKRSPASRKVWASSSCSGGMSFTCRVRG